MKHKQFNDVYPYTYFLTRISDNIKYHGVRYGNVSNNTSPINDFGISYFTSGSLADDFKLNPQNYKFKLCWTFDSPDEALNYEYKVNKRVVGRVDWANRSYGRTYIPSPDAFAKGQLKRIKKVIGTTKENCEYRRRQSEKLKGRSLSELHRQNLRKPKPPRSKDHCDNLSKSKSKAYASGSIKRLFGEDNPMFGKPSAIKGKRACHNPTTNHTMFISNSLLPDGYLWGDNPNVSKANAKGRKWYHNPTTGKSKMFIPGTQPTDFIPGRK